MRRVEIPLMRSTAGRAAPFSYPEVTQSTRPCPRETDRASDRREPFVDLHVACSKPKGFVVQEHTGDAPSGIVGRFGKPRSGELCAGDVAHGNEPRLPGNRRGDFMRPVLTDIGDFGMQRFHALLFPGALGYGQFGGIVPCDVGATERLFEMRTCHLIGEAQVDTDLRRCWRANQLGHLAREIHIPASTSVLAEAAGFHLAQDGPRQPQAKALAAIGERTTLQADTRGFEGNPGQRALARAPLELQSAKLALARGIFLTDTLHRLGMQAQRFRYASREGAQGIGREQGLVPVPCQQTHFLAIVPHVVYGMRHLEEMLACCAIFYTVSTGKR